MHDAKRVDGETLAGSEMRPVANVLRARKFIP